MACGSIKHCHGIILLLTDDKMIPYIIQERKSKREVVIIRVILVLRTSEFSPQIDQVQNFLSV